jgi:plastocyanin
MAVETVFYILGGALVATALVVSFIGIRGKSSFPPGGRAMTAGLAFVCLLVVATAAYAVASAREEQEHREEEQAHEEAEAAEGVEHAEGGTGEQAPEPGSPGGSPSGEPQGGPAVTLDVTSPEDGSLVFDPERLSAEAGTITLAYDNPSPVPHNIFLQDTEESVVAQSDDVTQGAVEISAELPPGEYFYYCNIPGHREGGMEGTLTVQ